MFKKMILIVLPLLLTACGMEYEGEIENYSYSDLQDESEMGFRSEGHASTVAHLNGDVIDKACYDNCCAANDTNCDYQGDFGDNLGQRYCRDQCRKKDKDAENVVLR